MKYAEIILFKKPGAFDDPLTYKVDSNTPVQVGDAVTVPFRNRTASGMVINLTDTAPEGLSEDKIRAISKKEAVSLELPSIELCKYIAATYKTSIARALRLMVPKKIWEGNFKAPAITEYSLLEQDPALRGDKQKLLVDFMRTNNGVSRETLQRHVPEVSLSTIQSLVKKGILQETETVLYEKADKTFPLTPFDKNLTVDQSTALDSISSAKKPVLLQGVTGSGKTEVYLRAITGKVQAGKQALLLVPEIALTPQMIEAFKATFGEHMAVFHSKLNDTERLHEWWKVKTGYARLAIGSRSAIFAPLDELGLIIVDEEHEWTYKQETSPYYLTHHIAEKMTALSDVTLVFGSATPSVETFYKAKEGIYDHVELKERINKAPLPPIEIVDLRDEFQKRNFSVLSLALQQKMKERLDKKEQVILFVNQRGLSSAVICRDCGHTEMCPSCDISLKHHKSFKGEILKCHYCNFEKNNVLLCPSCQSPHIKYTGVGTQKVEAAVKELFPEARVIRADRDTTSDKQGFAPIYKSFLNHEYDVLVGTQMIAKGLDFEKVSLIGLVLADVGLHIPDFRSHERLFQIVTQVAGRCGRGEFPGEVILQTYSPDHFTIKSAAAYEYQNFIEQELSFRKKLNYPPFSRMVKFTLVGDSQEKVSSAIETEEEKLRGLFKEKTEVKILSAPALIPKVNNTYHHHLLVRLNEPQELFQSWQVPEGWRIDIDPIHTT